jgi:quercetin dioxygenase-like cupin family protein
LPQLREESFDHKILVRCWLAQERKPYARPPRQHASRLNYPDHQSLGLSHRPGAGPAKRHKAGSNTHPLSFGPGQTIIDLKKVVWEPLKGEGIPPGVQIARLRGDLTAGGGELLVRLPANFTFPNHSHTSDEIYVWIQGDFTYVAEDGTATPLSRQAYISLPANVPHALRCGKTPCVFYVRYPGPFDYKIHPMPTRKK